MVVVIPAYNPDYHLIDVINNLHWGSIEVSHNIETIHGEKIGEIVTLL